MEGGGEAGGDGFGVGDAAGGVGHGRAIVTHNELEHALTLTLSRRERGPEQAVGEFS
jgi:hypothetical protein